MEVVAPISLPRIGDHRYVDDIVVWVLLYIDALAC
jgi:hypothetical protein